MNETVGAPPGLGEHDDDDADAGSLHPSQLLLLTHFLPAGAKLAGY